MIVDVGDALHVRSAPPDGPGVNTATTREPPHLVVSSAVVAELDYAYLAEFAQVIDGKLTAVNASFIHVNTPVPAMFQFAVAGRVRAPADAGEVRLAIKLVSPDGSATITWQVGLATAGHPVYNDKVGILFALRAACCALPCR